MLKRFPVLLGAAIAMMFSTGALAQMEEIKPAQAAEVTSPAETSDAVAPAEESEVAAPAEEVFDVEKPMVFGKTVYFADRPLTLPAKTGEARVDLYVGLNKGFEGRAFGIGGSLASERTAGLTFRGGIIGPFELGLSMQYIQTVYKGVSARQKGNGDGTVMAPVNDRGPEGDGTRRIAGYSYRYTDGYNHLVPAYMYARVRIIDQLAVELGIIIPTMQAEGFNRPTLRFGVPIQWIAIKGMLKLHFRPDLLIGFGTSKPFDPTISDKVVNLGVYVDAGITLSLAKLFFDVTVGYGVDVLPYKKGYVPLSMLIGYQVLPRLDVYAGFTLDNMTPAYGNPADARSLTTGIQCRF